jgi:hypothetical protein
MARNGPVSGFHRARCDHDFSRQEMLATRLSACSLYPQRPFCSQAGHQFTLECPALLDVQRLVYGLVRDPHPPIIRKIDLQSIGDLFRTPCRRPATVLTWSMATSNPSGLWAYDGRAILVGDMTSQALLDIVPQPIIARHFGGFWACRTAFSVPLSG